jgi:hypothetical protein
MRHESLGVCSCCGWQDLIARDINLLNQISQLMEYIPNIK